MSQDGVKEILDVPSILDAWGAQGALHLMESPTFLVDNWREVCRFLTDQKRFNIQNPSHRELWWDVFCWIEPSKDKDKKDKIENAAITLMAALRPDMSDLDLYARSVYRVARHIFDDAGYRFISVRTLMNRAIQHYKIMVGDWYWEVRIPKATSDPSAYANDPHPMVRAAAAAATTDAQLLWQMVNSTDPMDPEYVYIAAAGNIHATTEMLNALWHRGHCGIEVAKGVAGNPKTDPMVRTSAAKRIWEESKTRYEEERRRAAVERMIKNTRTI